MHLTATPKRVHFSGRERRLVGGPFAQTRELVASFWLWQVKSMDEAVDWVRRCPNPMPGGSEIEVRRSCKTEDFGPEFTAELREQEDRLRAAVEAGARKPG